MCITMSGSTENVVKKRIRSKNFTDLESRILVDIAVKYAGVIENKKTDAATWKAKENAWRAISEEFQYAVGTDRNMVVLRSKYEQIKHTIKRKKAKNKQEALKTRGAYGYTETQPFTDYEEKLLGYINTSAKPHGVHCPYECDTDLPSSDGDNHNNKTSTEILCVPEVVKIEAVDVEGEPADIESNQFEDFDESDEVLNMINTPPNNGTYTESPPECSSKKSKIAKWSQWNPSQSRERRHKRLMLERKNISKTNITKQVLNEKLDKITDTRQELVALQTQLCERELKYKEEEHQARMELLHLKIKNKKLEILLKEQELLK